MRETCRNSRNRGFSCDSATGFSKRGSSRRLIIGRGDCKVSVVISSTGGKIWIKSEYYKEIYFKDGFPCVFVENRAVFLGKLQDFIAVCDLILL